MTLVENKIQSRLVTKKENERKKENKNVPVPASEESIALG